MSAPPGLSRGLILGTAEALQSLALDAEKLGERLCSDPEIIERHLDGLQGIDRLSQSLGQLAAVLSADDPQQAVSQVGMADLQEHLQKSSAA